jgi:hypothetical protein
VPEVDVVDATWIDVPPASLAPFIAAPANWRKWWPDLNLRVDEWRAAKGVRWLVPSGRRGRVIGSMEIWLQAVDNGTVAHYFLRLDGTPQPLRPRERLRLERSYRIATKRGLWALADEFDPGRLARVSAPPSTLTQIP